MEQIYEKIARRTGGDIYIGVVGPVRTGKSTFIKNFMDTVVIPRIDNVYMRERARDELPQSGSGRTIMTAEPKFVPEEAVELSLDGSAVMKVRMIDCVGYMVDGALGQFEDDTPRMVTTPWFPHPIPMAEAAEVGTRKVIDEHSTIGLVITTDGSITDLPRYEYLQAEERVITELKELGKPFLVVVNTTDPRSAAAQEARREIAEKYAVSCEAANCLTLDEEGIMELLKSVLYEFPVKEIGLMLPVWANGLAYGHPVKTAIYENMLSAAREVKCLREVHAMAESLRSCPFVEDVSVVSIDLGCGSGIINIDMPQEIYYGIIEEEAGIEIHNEGEIIPLLRELSAAKREYDRIAPALERVRSVGYGIVMPEMEELMLEEPEIVRQGSRFGVRLRASAPSIHTVCNKQKLSCVREMGARAGYVLIEAEIPI